MSKNIGLIILLSMTLIGCGDNSSIVTFFKEGNDRARDRSKIIAISFLKPQHDVPIIEYIEDKRWIEKKHFVSNEDPSAPHNYFDGYFTYYNRLAKHYQNNGELWFFAGTVAYMLGQKDQAQEALKKSIDLNPRYFWAYHNLAKLLIEQGDLKTAMMLIEYAKNMPDEWAQLIINKSSIFQQYWARINQPGVVIRRHLKQGRQNLNKMMEDIVLIKNNQTPQNLSNIKIYLF